MTKFNKFVRNFSTESNLEPKKVIAPPRPWLNSANLHLPDLVDEETGKDCNASPISPRRRFCHNFYSGI